MGSLGQMQTPPWLCGPNLHMLSLSFCLSPEKRPGQACHLVPCLLNIQRSMVVHTCIPIFGSLGQEDYFEFKASLDNTEKPYLKKGKECARCGSARL